MTSPAQVNHGTLLLTGSQLLVLDGPPAGWLVEAGQVRVYRIQVKGDEPVGPRRYVLTAEAGDVLFGSVEGNVAGSDRFVATGMAGCQLRRIADIDDVTPAQLKRWIAQLGVAVAGDLPPGAPVSEAGGLPITLAEGAVFAPVGPQVRWLRVQSGAAAFLGLAEQPLVADSGVFPLVDGTWITATEPSQLVLLYPAEVASAEALAALPRLHGLVLAALARRDRHLAEQEAARIQERDLQEAIQTDEAVRRLASGFARQAPTAPAGPDLLGALTMVGRRLGVTFRSPPPDSGKSEEPVESIAHASRLRFRRVQLLGEWWRTDCGPLLGYLQEGEAERPIALLPARRGTYVWFDPSTGTQQPLTPEVSRALKTDAFAFFRPFPERSLRLMDLPIWGIRPYLPELTRILLIVLGVTLLGVLMPQATRWVIDNAIPDADRRRLIELALVLVAVHCGQAVFHLMESIYTLRIHTGATAGLQAATWDRLLRLGPNFFRRFISGDLLNRAMLVTEVSQQLSTTALHALVSGLLSLLYLLLLLYYSARLTLLAVAIAALSALVTTVLAIGIRRYALADTEKQGRLLGFVVQVIHGLGKLRVAGAERRAYAHWAVRFAERVGLTLRIRFLQDIGTLFTFIIPTVGSLALYLLAARQLRPDAGAAPLSTGTFIAFLTAFGMFMAGLTSVSQTLVEVMDGVAKQRLMQPILEAELESVAGRADPGRLHGHVAVEGVQFRYYPGGPLVLQGVSLVARPGEFVAVVGPSGSGKSTLLRLLLGFEKPQTGAVLYDGKSLEGLDLTAVRRQLGVVLQSAYVLGGTVYHNIACGNPLSLEGALAASRDAGFSTDLEKMPMGLHTVVSEGGTNLSGGQRQRLLIARALSTNPKILLLDEATSSLDNATQAIVTASLARRQVTRMVIAHRLSTIRDADRIYVLEHGRVVQVGTFEELREQDGLFRRLVARQSI